MFADKLKFIYFQNLKAQVLFLFCLILDEPHYQFSTCSHSPVKEIARILFDNIPK